jgi:HD-GYP domain-containing protein (c-di-GMP phosphodiesterase class II)
MTMERSLARLELHHGPGFGDHGTRVANLSHAVGVHIGLHHRVISRLWLAALIHDVGKTRIDPALLEKATELTEQETRILREHPTTGYEQLVDVAHPTVAEAVLCHHERWDGAGFPNGLSRKQIPILARIVFVADAYDVMTTGRTYRSQVTTTEAGEELTRLAGIVFDPEVVDTFASLDRKLLTPPTIPFQGPPNTTNQPPSTDPEV